ncbi:alpha/beta fold hydrolase [Psychrobacillus sp. FSL K6-2843]|uniref:alpha/beta hydrolase n=1 Tax=Psychrobacillus sp. FSL K6-2843 TaxID=2921549 RepID=UPI003159C590
MKTGILCIHGFTGGPYEVQPFVDYLEANTDWQIVVPTLPGHGEILELKSLTAESWMMAAEQALRMLQKEVDRVYVVGFSMGGIIAIYLALRYKIDKMVLLSAAAKYINPAQLLHDIGDVAKKIVEGKSEENTLFQIYSKKLRATPIPAALEFVRLVKMVEPYYEQITIPVCLVQGKKDGIVPYTAAPFLFDHIKSTNKQLIFSDSGKHHICYSDDCQNWFPKALAFLREEVQEKIC